VGSWLDGPAGAPAAGHPGERLGRPAQGTGSVARFGRRLVGIVVDWALCLLIARWLFDANQLAPLGVLAVEHLLLVGTLGTSVGHRVAGLRVETVAGGWAGPARAAVRTALLCLVVPALVWDADQRGLHDKAAGTVLVRA
jgi:uncharacterized RDD family membrane protein YckC